MNIPPKARDTIERLKYEVEAHCKGGHARLAVRLDDLATILEYADLVLPKHAAVNDATPVVLYLGSQKDAEELVEAVCAMHPNMKSVVLS